METIRRGDRFRHRAFLEVGADGRNTGAKLLIEVTKVQGDTVYWRGVHREADGAETLGARFYTTRAKMLENTRVEETR